MLFTSSVLYSSRQQRHLLAACNEAKHALHETMWKHMPDFSSLARLRRSNFCAENAAPSVDVASWTQNDQSLWQK
jgi:hypothetical protein